MTIAPDYSVYTMTLTPRRHYLSELQYDNVYITKYFKHIDARRKADGKKTLLPLKKFEKKDIIDPMKISRSYVCAMFLVTWC